MTDKITYESNWLFARYKLDSESRDKNLLHKFLQLKPVQIIDIGAGFGANVIFLSSHMPWDHSWKLVEIRKGLFAQGIKYMSEVLVSRGYEVITQGNSLVAKGTNIISIEYVNNSFTEYDYEGDAITCNAFFDIISFVDAEKFFSRIGGIPVYSTLNYRTMEIQGGDHWIQLYNLHMKRNGAMGPTVCSDLTAINHLTLNIGESIWIVDKGEIIHLLLDYMHYSVPEMINGREKTNFLYWLNRTKAQVKLVKVYHCDLLWS